MMTKSAIFVYVSIAHKNYHKKEIISSSRNLSIINKIVSVVGSLIIFLRPKRIAVFARDGDVA